jgi:sugar-specific transcriptional regulator TrmB
MNQRLKERFAAILMELGFSEYEARAYVTLLEKSPISRYELSKNARVPQPKIYETIERLHRKGYVSLTTDEVPLVMPLSPELLLERMNEEHASLLSELDAITEQVQETFAQDDGRIERIWSLSGTAAAIEKTQEVIDHSVKVLYLAGFPDELDLLQEQVQAAERRGVAISVLAYGGTDISSGRVAEHGEPEAITRRTGGRWLACTSDGKEVLVAHPLDGECESVWMNSPVISLMISKYVDEHFFEERLVRQPRRRES